MKSHRSLFLISSFTLVITLILSITHQPHVQCQIPTYQGQGQPSYHGGTHHQQQQQPSDMIHMSQISSITFHAHKFTTSRKNQPYPQLTCIGGTAKNSGYVPKLVNCQNLGTDGTSYQWKCEAPMDSEYKLGKVHVHCEGYTGPGDVNVVRNSCSLDYELDYTSKGLKSQNHRNNKNGRNNKYHQTQTPTPNIQQQQQQQQQQSRNQPIYQDSNPSSGSTTIDDGFLWFLGILAIFIFIIYHASSRKSTNNNGPVGDGAAAAAAAETTIPPYNPNATPPPPSSSSSSFSNNNMYPNVDVTGGSGYHGTVPPYPTSSTSSTSYGLGGEGLYNRFTG